MKRKVPYPKGRLLLVHDCTVDICLSNNPGAVLLSVLLFWYENPHLYDVLAGNDFTMCRTQASIETQSCNQIDVKTIHDTAVPLLHLLGYLTVQEKMNGNLYTLHMDRIFAAFTACENGNLKAFLKSQLESAPIVLCQTEIERTLINKKWLYFEIERTLIAIGADSHCRRGRKPKQRAALDAEIAATETYRESIERGVMRERENDFAVAQSSPAEMPSEHAYHFAGTQRQHLVWNCHTWCAVNHATCEDYVVAIDAGLHESPTDKMPAVPPNVTGVSHSQLSIPDGYMQGDVHDDTPMAVHSPGSSGDTGDTDIGRAGTGSVGHDTSLDRGVEGTSRARAVPEAAKEDIGAFDEHTRIAGNSRGHDSWSVDSTTDTVASHKTLQGQVAPIEQTVPSLSPGAVPARHSGQASDGAASTASPRSGPRASSKGRGKAPVEPVPIPIEARAILDDWDTVLKKPIPRTEKHVQAAVDLVPCHPSQEDLKGCKGWLFTTDNPQKPWFRKKGVTLQDVRDNYGAWQSVQPTEPDEDELEPYSIPWFLAQQARRQAQELQA